MSSAYRLLCLNHDPALTVGGGEWNDPEPAIAAALEPAMHDWLVEDHGKCELLVGRFSYPLVEVCCPAAQGKIAHSKHNAPVWIDRDWLVLLAAASAAPANPGLRSAIEQLGRSASCWSWERINRLRVHLGIDS